MCLLRFQETKIKTKNNFFSWFIFGFIYFCRVCIQSAVSYKSCTLIGQYPERHAIGKLIFRR